MPLTASDLTPDSGPDPLCPDRPSWYLSELPTALEATAGPAPSASARPHITQPQLERLVEWKLARGQWRPRLLQYAREQPAGAVEAASGRALAALRGYSPPGGASGGGSGGGGGADAALRSAVEALTSLKGVGPATASALLAAACPDVPYMGDEALAACLPAGRPSDYSLKAYLELAARLQHKARQLSEQLHGEGRPDQATAGSAASEPTSAAGGGGEQPDVVAHEDGEVATAAAAAPARARAPGDKRPGSGPSIGPSLQSGGGTGAGEGRGGEGRGGEDVAAGDGGGGPLSAGGVRGSAARRTKTGWAAAEVERCLWAAAVLSQQQGQQQGHGQRQKGQGRPGAGGGAEGAGGSAVVPQGGKAAKRARR